jgi:hypothetical protein
LLADDFCDIDDQGHMQMKQPLESPSPLIGEMGSAEDYSESPLKEDGELGSKKQKERKVRIVPEG